MVSSIDPALSESMLLASSVMNDKIHILTEKGITPNKLVVYGDVLEFIIEYNKKYSKNPDIDTITTVFPTFPEIRSNGCDFDFLVDVAVQNGKGKTMKEIIDRVITLNHESPDKAIEYAMSEIQGIKSEVKVSASYFDGDQEDRIDRYMKRKRRIEKGFRVGLPTGIPQLDKDLIGFVPGDFVILAGPPSVGKSFLIEKMCSLSYLSGVRVLYISPEMSEEDVTLRIHSIIGRHYGVSFSNEQLMTGGLSDESFDDYVKFLKTLSSRNDWIIIDEIEGGAFTVSKLETLIKTYNPTVVAIDSIILMTASDGSPAIGWQSLIDVAYGLKMLATRSKIVILATAPTVADTFESTDPATISELGLSKNMSFAIDIGLSMSKAHNPNSRFVSVFKKRKGHSAYEKQEIAFLPDIGIIG